MNNFNRFKGKSAIITGGAGHIARRTALRLALEGCKVHLCDVDGEKAKEVAEEINKMGGYATTCQVDVKESKSVNEAVERAIKEFNKIDILICAAGGSNRDNACYFCDQKEELIVDNININLYGAVFFSHAISNHMISNNYGRIVCITSVLATQGTRGHVEYSAAKGGVLSMTKALAMELAEYGITVNAVSPGLVERGERDVSDANFIGRNCLAEDVAALIAFVASDEASFITGHNHIIDGGWGLGVQRNIQSIRYDFKVMERIRQEKTEDQ